MSNDVQRLCVTGRLGRDAKVYTSSTGNEFIAFTIASNISVKKNEEKTTWWDVIIPNYLVPRYKKMIEYLKKGKSVFVDGQLDPSLIKLDDGSLKIQLTIKADAVDFMPSGGKRDTDGTTAAIVNKPKQTVVEQIPDDIPMSASPQPVTVAATSTQAAPQEFVEDADDLPF